MKKIIFILFISAFGCFNQLHSQSRFNLIYEQNLGMNFAGENINTGFHLFDYGDSLIIPKSLVKERKIGFVINPIYRFTKFFFVNYLFTDFVMTMNHERFGHGYRMIEAEGEIIEIVYNLPPPFPGSDFSYISYKISPNETPQQQLAVKFGGSEANLVFSDILRKNAILEGRFSHNFSFPYLYGSNDMPGYTAFITNPWGDPNAYRNLINAFYGEEKLTREKMKTYSLIGMLTDPINFYAFKSLFFDYLIKGKHSCALKMIGLSPRLKYLPRFRFEYTPYGPELVYQNYFKLDSKLLQLNVSHSDGTFAQSWRVSLNAWNLQVSKRLSFNLSGQIWQQPTIDYYINEKGHQSEGLGGQLVSILNYDIISEKHTFGLTFQSGYKSSGYALGEQLDKGLIIGGGLTLKLGGNSH
ncbi:MAG: hypothetical protein P8L20_11735 [Flavobacteriales bacterium]|nr:hypothetical protein [Flavobacteriales bacterium]